MIFCFSFNGADPQGMPSLKNENSVIIYSKKNKKKKQKKKTFPELHSRTVLQRSPNELT